MNINKTKTCMAVGLGCLLIFFMGATNCFAWSGITHSRLAEEVALQGGVTDQAVIDVLSEQANWADSNESEDGVGAYGYDEEMNPWYDTGSLINGANADHWLDVYNYDRWWSGPDGEAQNDCSKFDSNASAAFQSGDYETGFLLLGRGQHYVEDIGNPYHTIFWQNLDGYHATYETWVDSQWDNPDMELALWVRSGAYYSGYYDNMSIKEIVVDLAHTSKPLLDYVKDGSYTQNLWATQYLMWYTARALAAVNAQAGPSNYFSY